MSELKAYRIKGVTLGDFHDVYLKSEADKVIADKDETIDELKERNAELQKATDSAWSKVNALYDELRHHKYNQCLDIAQWSSYKSEVFDQYSRHTDYIPNIEKYRRKRDHYADRCNKLLLLAEKFKEAK